MHSYFDRLRTFCNEKLSENTFLSIPTWMEMEKNVKLLHFTKMVQKMNQIIIDLSQYNQYYQSY